MLSFQATRKLIKLLLCKYNPGPYFWAPIVSRTYAFNLSVSSVWQENNSVIQKPDWDQIWLPGVTGSGRLLNLLSTEALFLPNIFQAAVRPTGSWNCCCWTGYPSSQESILFLNIHTYHQVRIDPCQTWWYTGHPDTDPWWRTGSWSSIWGSGCPAGSW